MARKENRAREIEKDNYDIRRSIDGPFIVVKYARDDECDVIHSTPPRHEKKNVMWRLLAGLVKAGLF
jgi:hypothetical protein